MVDQTSKLDDSAWLIIALDLAAESIDIDDGILDPGLDLSEIPAEELPEGVSPEIFQPDSSSGLIGGSLEKHFYATLIEEEGYRERVYFDTTGKAHIGVGHLILPEDGLKAGDTITKEQAMAFLEEDADEALAAAKIQAAELGMADNLNFVCALGHLNFQLGTSWNTEKFPDTWAKMVNGDIEGAKEVFKDCKWAKQTPDRVENWIKAIDKAFPSTQVARRAIMEARESLTALPPEPKPPVQSSDPALNQAPPTG